MGANLGGNLYSQMEKDKENNGHNHNTLQSTKAFK